MNTMATGLSLYLNVDGRCWDAFVALLERWGVVRWGVVRCGGVWCGAVRYGVVRWGVVRWGVVQWVIWFKLVTSEELHTQAIQLMCHT